MVTHLYCEYLPEPPAIGTRKPRFSWEVPLPGRARRQTAYQVLVASSPDLLQPGGADLWDSGKVESSRSTHVVYEGAELQGNHDYFWCVQVWEEADQSTGFGPAAYFGTALFDESDWQAQWIGMGRPDEPVPDPDLLPKLLRTTGQLPPDLATFEPDLRAPLLRKNFQLAQPVKRARAFVCGLGLYELRLNGAKVGDAVLATPRTEFRKRLLYSTYDITGLLKSGANAVGVILGNGWFNGQKKYWRWAMPWFGSPRAIVQLEIELADGNRVRVNSDDSWRGDWSPITFNCLYDGEEYDARLEQEGWDRAEFDAGRWRPVNRVRAPGGRLRPIAHEPNRVVEMFRPVAMRETAPGVFVYDLGRNMTGWVRLKARGGTVGQVVALRFAEEVNADGTLNRGSLGDARQEDRYVLNGAAAACYEPRFTYHGFQYVELTGYPGRPDLDTLEGCFVHGDVQRTGQFECGHALLNRIHQCTVQTQLCNIQMGVVTDDTQRDERLGWADCWESATETYYNFWMPRVWAKWIADYYDQQDELGMVGYIVPLPCPGEDLVWSASFLLIPWWQYLHCGDRRILEESYASQQRYVAYLEATGTKTVTNLATVELEKRLRWQCPAEARFPAEADRGHLQISYFGDHLATHEGASGFCKNQPLSVATAFYYLIVSTLARIAETLDRQADAKRYRGLADKIKAAYNDRFFDPNWGYYDIGSQSAQGWALAFGLVPAEHRDQVAMYLCSSVNFRQRRLTTGLTGTRHVIEAIAQSCRGDVIWNRAIATDYPSWGYMLRDPKRTTMAENWYGAASLCHSNLGAAIDEWFYWGLAGIRPDETGPGYAKIIFEPYLPKDLPWAKASLRTLRGEIVSHWEHDGKKAVWKITVPANSTAQVRFPVEKPEGITESGVPVRCEGGKPVFEIGSGTYCFEFPVTWK